jgi:glycosyltransferase involved in cell wall biosynthesis
MNEFDVPADRVVVMEHGVDKIPETTTKPLPGPSLKVLLFGGVLPYKGVDIFLQALQFCGEVIIDASIAGEPRNATYAAEIEKLIGEVPYPHRADWIRGFIPEHEVQAHFEQADVVVMPYRHIDQSGVLFTAFRFGTPVVCFDVGAFRDYVPEYAGIVVAEQTPQALAEGMMAFSKVKETFDRNAIQAYAKSFSWNNTVRVLLPFLNKTSRT